MKISKASVTKNNKIEWARMADDCYAHKLTFYGRWFAASAKLPIGHELPKTLYESLQKHYSNWVKHGVSGLPPQ